VRKTQEGGVELCYLFLRFLLSCRSDVQNLDAADKTERERDKKDTTQLYRFLPQTESSPVPLALPRRVH